MGNKNELRKEQATLESIFGILSKVFHISAFALAFFFVSSVVSAGIYLTNFDSNVLAIFNVLFYIEAFALIATAIFGALVNSLEHRIHEIDRQIFSPYLP